MVCFWGPNTSKAKVFGSLGLDGLYNEPVGCLSMSQFFHGMAIMTSNPAITKGKNAHDGHVDTWAHHRGTLYLYGSKIYINLRSFV